MPVCFRSEVHRGFSVLLPLLAVETPVYIGALPPMSRAEPWLTGTQRSVTGVTP